MFAICIGVKASDKRCKLDTVAMNEGMKKLHAETCKE
jgi:hypothetical protein